MRDENGILHIVTLNHERMNAERGAMLTPMRLTDQYRIGEEWHSCADPGMKWIHGTQVDGVKHYTRHETQVGDVMIVERVDLVPIAHVQIVGIEMADTAQMSDDEFVALGYISREDFYTDMGSAFGGRVWVMSIAHVTPQATPGKVQ